jgi:uncharacterized protein (TIGR02266 family)
MAQDTRKDPRAKVLTMTVRYKSATLDEFIEHHSYDVSLGGMLIKTPSPFPPGTLLKFEVKIADDQKLMQGVGRVVWKRETADSTPEKPAGMGVKFIKVDEESKRVIGQLVANRGDESSSAFDAGSASKPPAAGGSKAPAAKTAAPRPSPSKAPAAGGASKGAQAGSGSCRRRLSPESWLRGGQAPPPGGRVGITWANQDLPNAPAPWPESHSYPIQMPLSGQAPTEIKKDFSALREAPAKDSTQAQIPY